METRERVGSSDVLHERGVLVHEGVDVGIDLIPELGFRVAGIVADPQRSVFCEQAAHQVGLETGRCRTLGVGTAVRRGPLIHLINPRRLQCLGVELVEACPGKG